VYRGDINNTVGILHLRNVSRLLDNDEVNKATLMQLCREPYFIPESTPLHTQLFNFQKERRRIGIVVDEYGGDVLGIATLEDILEEIVGEFTTDFASSSSQDILPQDDGTTIVDGTTPIRTLNRALSSSCPLTVPRPSTDSSPNTLKPFPRVISASTSTGYAWRPCRSRTTSSVPYASIPAGRSTAPIAITRTRSQTPTRNLLLFFVHFVH